MSTHPLDPLSTEEFRQAAAILRRDRGVGDRWRVASIELREPSKQTVRDFEPGGPIIREALVVCWNRDDGQAFKAVVSLTEDRVLSWEPARDHRYLADIPRHLGLSRRADTGEVPGPPDRVG